MVDKFKFEFGILNLISVFNIKDSYFLGSTTIFGEVDSEYPEFGMVLL